MADDYSFDYSISELEGAFDTEFVPLPDWVRTPADFRLWLAQQIEGDDQ